MCDSHDEADTAKQCRIEVHVFRNPCLSVCEGRSTQASLSATRHKIMKFFKMRYKSLLQWHTLTWPCQMRGTGRRQRAHRTSWSSPSTGLRGHDADPAASKGRKNKNMETLCDAYLGVNSGGLSATSNLQTNMTKQRADIHMQFRQFPAASWGPTSGPVGRGYSAASAASLVVARWRQMADDSKMPPPEGVTSTGILPLGFSCRHHKTKTK